eukprot:291565_1
MSVHDSRVKNTGKRKSLATFKRRNSQLVQTPNGMNCIIIRQWNYPDSSDEEREKECGKYAYICQIGASRFDRIFKVKNEISDNDEHFYAVKVRNNLFTSTNAKRYLKELRILRSLSKHENIVELIDVIPPVNPLKFSKLS